MQKDFEINFIKFTPTPGFKIYADVELGNLMEFAPSDSICTATVEKTGEWYLCRMVMSDCVEPIYSTVFGDSPQSALSKGIEKMADKLRARKNRRFERMRVPPSTAALATASGNA